MPIYEYRCEDCGSEFEQLTLSSQDGEETSCRTCAGTRVRRLLSAFAVGHSAAASAESGPCGACGASQRGMCGMDG